MATTEPSTGSMFDTDTADTSAAPAERGTIAPGSRRWGHLPALDGLRGLAVLAVLLFHGGVGWAQGGFLGVDMFFVLSGFLITSLLLEERGRTGGIRLRNFWVRRARRLLPALLALLAATAAFAALVASPEALAGIRRDVIATLAYVANWHFIAEQSSYFARTGDPSPLAHTWSLAIEEQFYLLWPIVVLLVARGRRPLLKIGLVAGAGTLASALAMIVLYHPGADPSRVYYGTDTRSQVILVGAVLAVLLAAWRRREEASAGERTVELKGAGAEAAPAAPAPAGTGTRVMRGATVLAVGGVGAAIALARGSDAWVYRGGLFAVAVAVAVVIAGASVLPAGLLSSALTWAPLRATGRISYGMYLWHWPLYLVLDHARTGMTGYPLLGVRLAATVWVSLLSYWFLEMPVRRGALPRWRAAVALPVSVGGVMTAVVMTTAVPLTTLPASAAATTAAVHPAPPAQTRSTRPPLAAGQAPKVMMVGDSVAETLGEGLQSTARRWGIALDNQGTLGCGVVRGGPYRYFGAVDQELPQCESWPQHWSDLIARHDPDVVFMIVGRWEVMDRVHDGQWTRVGDPAFDRYLESELDRAVDVLSARGAQIALATTPYFLRGERPDGGRWPEDDPARVDAFNKLIRDVAARHPTQVTIVDLGGHTSIGGVYTKYIDGLLMRYDGVHFTQQAARWLAPWLFPQLLALAPPGSSLPPVPPPTTPEYATTTTWHHTYTTYHTTTTIHHYYPVTTVARATTTTTGTTPTTQATTVTTRPVTSTTTSGGGKGGGTTASPTTTAAAGG